MIFKLLNSIDPDEGTGSLVHNGIGLDNVIRRLQLLYKDNYQFGFVKMREVFVVNLSIELRKIGSSSQNQTVKETRNEYA